MPVKVSWLGRAVVAAVVCATASVAVAQPSVVWTRQAATSDYDYGESVACDNSGRAYLAGSMWSDSPYDGFLAQFHTNGDPQWLTTVQAGVDWNEMGHAVAADGLGNIWLAGHVEDHYGVYDGFVYQFNTAGGIAHQTRLYMDYSSANGVCADGSGSAYVVATTDGTGYLAKVTAGEIDWDRSFATSAYGEGLAVACDADGNVYVTGHQMVDYGGVVRPDLLVKKYSPSGTPLWSKSFGTQWGEIGTAIAADHLGNVYVGGYTTGHFQSTNQGGEDAFVLQLSAANGEGQWGTQFGTEEDDILWALACDAAGVLYITGDTGGDLAAPNQGYTDVFHGMVMPDGTIPWMDQWGTAWFDSGSGLSITGQDMYLSFTGGDSSAGTDYDAYISKYLIPEPASLGLLALGGLAMIRRREPDKPSPKPAADEGESPKTPCFAG